MASLPEQCGRRGIGVITQEVKQWRHRVSSEDLEEHSQRGH